MSDAPSLRLIHFSDTHLGHQQYSRTDPATGLNQREQDHYDAFAKVVDHAIMTRPDLVIHAGDLFDGVRPGNRALAVAIEGFLKLSKAGIPVVAIAGNHEHPKLSATGSPFRLFEHLDNVYPVYQGKLETIKVGGAAIHAVAQCKDNDELAATIAAIKAVPDMPNILVVHGAVLTLETFKHAEFNELNLDPNWFDDRFDYVALGHFHSQAQVRSNAWYSGAPDRVSIAEAREKKGCLQVTIEGGRAKVEQVQIVGRPYVDLPAIKAGGMDGGEILQAAIDALQRAPAHAVARLTIAEIDSSLRGVLDQKAIREGGRHLLHLDLRLSWSEDAAAQAGTETVRGIEAEFSEFAATYPVESLDRKRLIEMARQVLGQQRGAP